ncbi:hypothetical protein EUTSA_v10019431mg [Eutrema salsugineum]|uniref:SCP domain-containing protein n=1 Tax=Eutrema salsugineum TaxID=72664 RepID=V4K9V7_EUTSA|nr:hypothetical protein EUTSA_v10019431mg [Eutrema salsugineum]
MKILIIVVIISAALFPALVQSRHVKCDRFGGNCIGGGKETIRNMGSSWDVSRRILQAARYISYNAMNHNTPAKQRYISYDAMKHNVPAKQHGQKDLPDNHYRRACLLNTLCLRISN